MAKAPSGGSGGDATRNATSQAQSGSAEEEHKRANDPEDKVRGGDPDTDIQFFDGTVAKVDAEGRTVMSDHLAPGETLRRETTDRYSTIRAEKRDDARAAKRDDTRADKRDDTREASRAERDR
jgi:hypothetical protein